MKRKLIKQGLGGYTIYLPKKWIGLRNLKPSDEVEITEEEGKLVIDSKKQPKKQEITIEIPSEIESLARRLIINPYRMGYDRIIIKYEHKKLLKIIKQVIEKHIIGFEIISYSNDSCILESITEPSIDNFNNLLNKQFFILKETTQLLLENLKKRNKERSKQIKELILNVHKHSNFLRRCISKRLFSTKLAPFYWLFLSHLTLAGRKLMFLNNHADKNKIKINSDIKMMFEALKNILDKLHRLYLTKDLKLLHEIHNIEHKYTAVQGIKMLDSKKNNEKVVIHYLINIIRMIYHASSPLVIIIRH